MNPTPPRCQRAPPTAAPTAEGSFVCTTARSSYCWSESVPKEPTTRARCSAPEKPPCGPGDLQVTPAMEGGAWVRRGVLYEAGPSDAIFRVSGGVCLIHPPERIHLLAKIGQGRRRGHWQPGVACSPQGGSGEGRHISGEGLPTCITLVSFKSVLKAPAGKQNPPPQTNLTN